MKRKTFEEYLRESGASSFNLVELDGKTYIRPTNSTDFVEINIQYGIGKIELTENKSRPKIKDRPIKSLSHLRRSYLEMNSVLTICPDDVLLPGLLVYVHHPDYNSPTIDLLIDDDWISFVDRTVIPPKVLSMTA